MNISGNTVLITGGGSGIGRGLAEALYREGNQVIISGRRKAVLEEVSRAVPGIKGVTVDMEDPASIQGLADQMGREVPGLNVVIHNAGVMRPEDLTQQATAETPDAEAMINTNLLGPIRLTAALMPLLRRQPAATMMTVTSGLAFLPLAMTPTYCATKAALHSWTQSLRWQLRDTSVEVIELVPPYVQTELMGPGQAADPRAMPLADFLSEVMQILKTQPTPKEVCVERVKPLRFAAESGKFDETFKGLNEAMPAPH